MKYYRYLAVVMVALLVSACGRQLPDNTIENEVDEDISDVVEVTEVVGDVEGDPADDPEQGRLGEDEPEHVASLDADGPEDADLLPSLGRAHQHHVEDGDPGDEQGDGADGEQEGVQQAEEAVYLADDRRELEDRDAFFTCVHFAPNLLGDSAGLGAGVGVHDNLVVAVGDEDALREDDGVVRADGRDGVVFREHGDHAVVAPLDGHRLVRVAVVQAREEVTLALEDGDGALDGRGVGEGEAFHGGQQHDLARLRRDP